MNNKNFVLVLVVIAMLMVILGRQNEREALAEHDLYCEMIALWEANSHVSPEQRPGWPPYKGKEVCDDTTTE